MTQPRFGVAPTAFRLPHDIQLGPVRLAVSNLTTSTTWYQETLGLTVSHRDDDHAQLSTADGGERLIELEVQPGLEPLRRGHERLGLYHLALLLPNRSHLGSFIMHLAGLQARAGTADHSVSEAIYLSDPDGLGIEVYADRPADTWGVEDGQLAMDTRPLDVMDLARAGQDQPWRGLPEGSTIGHVHLHVGDLATSDASYHDALGFDRVLWRYPGASFLSAGGYHHHVGTNVWAAGAPPAGPTDPRLLHWTLRLPDAASLDALAANLERQGQPLTRTEQGLVSHDPWGTPVHVEIV